MRWRRPTGFDTVRPRRYQYAIESLEWITDRDRFAAIAPQWDGIADHERTPFLKSSWIDAWCAAFAGRRRLRVAVLWRDGALAAGLPLLSAWRRWDATVDNHTPEFGLLAADAEAGTRIVAEVLAQSNALVVPALAADGPTMQKLLEATHGSRRWTLIEPMQTSLVTDTSISLEEYRERLSPKVRPEVRRLRRKTEREHELQLAPLEAPDDLDGLLRQAFELEARGWKGRAGTAIMSAPETVQFYRRIAQDFHAAGALRISQLWLDRKLAAMALSIIHGRRVFTLKVAYDEDHRRLGPGFVLLVAVIERCFELGLDAYEFSGPDREYQRRFATGERPYRCVRIYRPGPVNAIRYAYHRRLRSVIRSAYHRGRRAGVPDLRRTRVLPRNRQPPQAPLTTTAEHANDRA